MMERANANGIFQSPTYNSHFPTITFAIVPYVYDPLADDLDYMPEKLS